MQIGELFLWDEFPYPKDGNPKPRLFIFLGKSSIFFPPIIYYIATFTSQTKYYELHGKREKNTIVKFKQEEFNLDSESVIDLDNDIYDFITENEFNNNENIRFICKISNEKLKLIYEKLLITGISKQIKIDIHYCLNSIGIIGLRRPK